MKLNIIPTIDAVRILSIIYSWPLFIYLKTCTCVEVPFQDELVDLSHLAIFQGCLHITIIILTRLTCTIALLIC